MTTAQQEHSDSLSQKKKKKKKKKLKTTENKNKNNLSALENQVTGEQKHLWKETRRLRETDDFNEVFLFFLIQ